MELQEREIEVVCDLNNGHTHTVSQHFGVPVKEVRIHLIDNESAEEEVVTVVNDHELNEFRVVVDNEVVWSAVRPA